MLCGILLHSGGERIAKSRRGILVVEVVRVHQYPGDDACGLSLIRTRGPMGSHEWSAHRLYLTGWVLYFRHGIELCEKPRIQW